MRLPAKRRTPTARGVLVLPAAALLAVAGHQVVRVHADDLTPWKGGGFGMFSTVDSGGGRVLEVSLRTGESTWQPVRFLYRALDRRLRSFPALRDLERFGHELLERSWCVIPDRSGRSRPKRPDTAPLARPFDPTLESPAIVIRPEAVELRVLRPHFHLGRLSLTYSVLRSSTVRRQETSRGNS